MDILKPQINGPLNSNTEIGTLAVEWYLVQRGEARAGCGPAQSRHHRLRGSASTVLTATGQVNGRWRILTPHRIETHEPTATKFRTTDYVRGRTP